MRSTEVEAPTSPIIALPFQYFRRIVASQLLVSEILSARQLEAHENPGGWACIWEMEGALDSWNTCETKAMSRLWACILGHWVAKAPSLSTWKGIVKEVNESEIVDVLALRCGGGRAVGYTCMWLDVVKSWVAPQWQDEVSPGTRPCALKESGCCTTMPLDLCPRPLRWAGIEWGSKLYKRMNICAKFNQKTNLSCLSLTW